ncbi:hypothetical protein [Actinomadura bangladeshensis]|uniref:Uncharacterized protein n=1 Tax=Actinomadura bangladeshensis TaxID=453573 RepID=A0A4R4PBX9_9ACTN|nr:hypothetical protein [Actinomadura bangladeshensis]TDC19935.1 hypothetical protein E1284_02030 [Actinomadura bangladeshensis]
MPANPTVPPNATVQERITWYWNQDAPGYQQFQEQRLAHPDYSAAWTRIWRDALPDGTGTVLDIGTGTGHADRPLRPRRRARRRRRPPPHPAVPDHRPEPGGLTRRVPGARRQRPRVTGMESGPIVKNDGE